MKMISDLLCIKIVANSIKRPIADWFEIYENQSNIATCTITLLVKDIDSKVYREKQTYQEFNERFTCNASSSRMVHLRIKICLSPYCVNESSLTYHLEGEIRSGKTICL